MPESLRGLLSRGRGELIGGGDLLETAVKTLEKVRDCRPLIGVGDVVCSSIIEAGRMPEICVVDGKSRRTPINGLMYGVNELIRMYGVVLKARNPPTHISEESLKALGKALHGLGKRIRSLIIIDGEEDLLTLPITAEAPISSCILYGIPGRGISVIRVDEGIREEARELLKEFVEVNPS